MMYQIVAPWLFREHRNRPLAKNGGKPRVESLDGRFTLKSSQRRMRDRPFACCAVMRGRQQSGAGFSIYELDRALAMLWS
jgi:hypothetical protein